MQLVRHNDISLTVLPGWSDETQVVLTKKAPGKFRPNIVIASSVLGEGETLDNYVLKTVANLKRTFKGYRTEEEGPAKFGQWDGYKVEYSFVANQTNCRQMQFLTVIESKCY